MNKEYYELLLKSQRDTNLLLGAILSLLAQNTGNIDLVKLADELNTSASKSSLDINDFLNL